MSSLTESEPAAEAFGDIQPPKEAAPYTPKRPGSLHRLHYEAATVWGDGIGGIWGSMFTALQVPGRSATFFDRKAPTARSFPPVAHALG